LARTGLEVTAFEGHRREREGSEAPLAATYLAWTALWVLVALALATMAFKRRDL
jgi:hypothetical protein